MSYQIEYNPDDFLFGEEEFEDKEKSQNKLDCPHCGVEDELINDKTNGYVRCNNCQHIVRQIITSHEGYQNAEENTGIHQNRCGGRKNIYLSSSVGSTTVGLKLYGAKKVQGWIDRTYKQQKQKRVHWRLRDVNTESNLPKVVLNTAMALYHTLDSKQILSRAMPKKALEAVCYYKACVINNIGLTHYDVAELYQVPVKHLTIAINKFMSVMEKTIHQKELHQSEREMVPSFIRRYCKILMMDEIHIEAATKIALNAEILSILSQSISTSRAVASIYFIIMYYKIKLPIKEILERLENNKGKSIPEKKTILKKKKPIKPLLSCITKQSEVTINKTFNILNEYDKVLTSTDWFQDKTPEDFIIKVPDIVPIFIN